MTRKLTIGDIHTTDIVYYDPQYAQECLDFCQKRDIDLLPSIDDPHTVHILDSDQLGFNETAVDSARIVHPADNIFSPALLEKFRDYHLLLVHENDELVGVVHFADYSKPAVSVYLFEILFEYEKTLRALLEKRSFTDEDMLDYFRRRAAAKKKDEKYYGDKLDQYEKLRSKHEKLLPFQAFLLNDLIGFAVDQGVFSGKSRVTELRNAIAHARELVEKQDPTANDLIYDPESFTRLFKLGTQLLVDYRRIYNLQNFV